MPSTRSISPTGDPYVDGLLSGVEWVDPDLTFSFPTSSLDYGIASLGYANGEPNSGFAAFSATQQAAARSVLAHYASVSGLVFHEVTGLLILGQGDLRFGQSNVPATAYAYYPHPSAVGGDLWFNNDKNYYDDPVRGNYAYATILHEVGHALGLKHAHEAEGPFAAIPSSHDTMEFTVMTYRSYAGASVNVGYVNDTWGFAQTPMMDDIAAIQAMYGADYKTNGGDTVYAWHTGTGEMFVNGSPTGRPGGNTIFQTVWDGGGTDTYDFSNYSTNLRVNLSPGAWSTPSTAQLADLHWNGTKPAVGSIANAKLYQGDTRSLIENAIGGPGKDQITGNTAANRLEGGGGNDTLYGGPGGDRLYGGSGTDIASYSSASKGVTASLASTASNTNDAKGDVYSSIEGLKGSRYADSFTGNDGANRLYGEAGNDRLSGGSGNDLLIGGTGADRLYGGGGADTFMFKATTESNFSAFDTIFDFSLSGGDRIDLSMIDANTRLAGDQSFTYLGTAAFKGKPGDLRTVKEASDSYVYADVNGDRKTDLKIHLDDALSLTKEDFIL